MPHNGVKNKLIRVAYSKKMILEKKEAFQNTEKIEFVDFTENTQNNKKRQEWVEK